MNTVRNILFVFGTRPEAIKLAPVIHKFKSKNHNFQTKVCVTAQHREMLDQVLSLFEIAVDFDLNIMKKNQSLSDVTFMALRKLEEIIKQEKPDMVLVQGDTTTTFAASLAAYYSKIKIGHVEAGLRTKDKFNPFPEEANRRLTDCLSDLFFVPTDRAKENLLSEEVDEEKIFVTGNTVVDALLMIVQNQKKTKIKESYERLFRENYGIELDSQRSILVTVHRRESFGPDIEKICQGLRKIAFYTPREQIIWPLHLNPNVQKPVRKILGNVNNIHLIEPLDYTSFVWLMNRSYLILTDSGGIQEEAPSLGKPVLVMRKVTERSEGIEAGTAKLVGTHGQNIFSETLRLLEDDSAYQAMAKAVNPYGDGKASDRITAILKHELGKNPRILD